MAFDPSITAFADGSYVVSYTVGSGSDTDIVARIVSPTGTVGPQFDIDNQTDNRNFSEVATLTNGNFVVVDQDERSGSATDTDIDFAIFTPAGTPVIGPAPLPGAAAPTFPESDPDVAALRDGGFVAVWTVLYPPLLAGTPTSGIRSSPTTAPSSSRTLWSTSGAAETGMRRAS